MINNKKLKCVCEHVRQAFHFTLLHPDAAAVGPDVGALPELVMLRCAALETVMLSGAKVVQEQLTQMSWLNTSIALFIKIHHKEFCCSRKFKKPVNS